MALSLNRNLAAFTPNHSFPSRHKVSAGKQLPLVLFPLSCYRHAVHFPTRTHTFPNTLAGVPCACGTGKRAVQSAIPCFRLCALPSLHTGP